MRFEVQQDYGGMFSSPDMIWDTVSNKMLTMVEVCDLLNVMDIITTTNSNVIVTLPTQEDKDAATNANT